VKTTEEAALDIQAFVQIVKLISLCASGAYDQFFETFKEFEGRAFHMAGESYGVRIPWYLEA